MVTNQLFSVTNDLDLTFDLQMTFTFMIRVTDSAITPTFISIHSIVLKKMGLKDLVILYSKM